MTTTKYDFSLFFFILELGILDILSENISRIERKSSGKHADVKCEFYVPKWMTSFTCSHI